MTESKAPMSSRSGLPLPPDVSPTARRWMRRIMSPIETFLHIEASSGIVLIVAAVIAMVLANSRWSTAFHALLELPLGVRIGTLAFERPIHFWINDALMTIFFFVVGLEIRREIYEGELSTARRAALPIAAALGGMVAPALLYLAIAGHIDTYRAGWGIPMATDIAFAVGVLALLGKRVPAALRILLLALAIIDDIGSIVVIATFYSAALNTFGFVIAAAGISGIWFLQRIGTRSPFAYVLPGVVVWAGVLVAGVHPTIGGVIIGLLTPARSWLRPADLARTARRSADDVEYALSTGVVGSVDANVLAEEAARIDLASREVLAPATRLQLLLHPWVAFVIMPLFALANAGVTVDALHVSPLSIGIVVGLLVGKPLGIIGVCLLVVRLELVTLPRGIGGRELTVLGLVAGIGFTMALFVASLAFPGGERLEEAKLAILVASTCAMTLGITVGRSLLARDQAALAAPLVEAERSDDV